jgi:hypothetical protein
MTPKPYTNPTPCRFCGREVEAECQRRHCQFRAKYLRQQSLLPPPRLDMDASEWPEPVTTREIDGVSYTVVHSGELQRRNLCGSLSGWTGTETATALASKGSNANE